MRVSYSGSRLAINLIEQVDEIVIESRKNRSGSVFRLRKR